MIRYLIGYFVIKKSKTQLKTIEKHGVHSDLDTEKSNLIKISSDLFSNTKILNLNKCSYGD
jgi:hypothetical protein